MPGLILHSIQYGIADFLFVEQDLTELDYYYYAYQTKKAEVLIMQLSVAGDSAKYYLEDGDFALIWAKRKGSAAVTYVYPSELLEPKA